MLLPIIPSYMLWHGYSVISISVLELNSEKSGILYTILDSTILPKTLNETDLFICHFGLSNLGLIRLYSAPESIINLSGLSIDLITMYGSWLGDFPENFLDLTVEKWTQKFRY